MIVGAGVNAKNVYEQLRVADGAIVGSYFKEDIYGQSDTRRIVSREKVGELMKIVRSIREL